MFDGEPPPRCGNVWASVWHDGGRTSEMRTCLNEVHGVYVTLTIRLTRPFDQWVQHRDELELRANDIRALIHKDQYNFAICRAAAVLAEFDQTGSQPIGWREALMFDGFDAIQTVGNAWFKANPDSGPEVGIAQRIRFGKARRIQALFTET